MTALEPISSSTTHQAQQKQPTSSSDDLQSSETLLNSDLLLSKNQYSPLISTSTSTKIDLFRKYKQQILTTSSESLVPGGNSAASFEDLKTYSTPPQSPPFALLLRSSPAPLSPLIATNTTTTTCAKLGSQSNLMLNEDSKQTNTDDENKCSTSSTESTTQATIKLLDNTNLDHLHSKIKQNNELLKEKLKLSYERYKTIQTKYFHSHVAEQLNKILELKEKQQQQKLASNQLEKSQTSVKEEATTTTSPSNKSSIAQQTSSQIDDNSVDLLTSILKSNLNNHTSSSNTNTNSNVDVAVKSLLDDIKYEILKQTDDKRHDEANVTNSDTDNEESESSVTTTSILLNDSFGNQLADNVFDDVDLAVEKLKNVNTKKHPPKSNSDIQSNESSDFLNEKKQQNEEKKLIDSSNLFWNMNKSQLGSHWECVQTKLKYLKLKQKQCNDYTTKANRFLLNVNNSSMKSLLNQISSETRTSQHLPTSIKTTNTVSKPQQDEKHSSEEAAIAALSSSLQESVAAVVNTPPFTQQTDSTSLIESGLSASRCVPFRGTTKNRSHSRLFNLNRNDLVRLDDDVIRSLFFTLKYFSTNYLKTMCSCSQLSKWKKSVKQRAFSVDLDAAEAGDDEDDDHETNSVKKRKKSTENVSLAADLLAMNKTCIFCHLLKEYEKTKMNEINLNNKLLIETKYKNFDLNNNTITDEEEGEGEEETTKLADLNVVRSDHSYCKQSTFLVSHSSKRLNQMSSLASGAETNELLERLVSDRLNRIFSNENNGKFLFEKYSKYEESDELIDAGFDLTPNDLQNLPDLSYDELKFLNEIDDGCSTNMRKLNTNASENLDEIEICDDLMNNESIFLNQSYPLLKENNRKNNKFLSSSFTYKPKYRNVLKQQSTSKTNKKRKLDTTTTTLNELQTSTTNSKRGRKQSVSSITNETKTKNQQTKKLAASLSSSSSSSLFSARQKRNRSTSSSTTTSSSSSFNDSSSTDQAKSSAGYYYNYYVTNSQNKFDIDNIVIPHDMVSNSAKSVHVEPKHVPTPRWRVLDIEPEKQKCELDENDKKEEIEPLDDSIFIERHKQKEHEMIMNRTRIFKKNKSTSSSSSTRSLSISSLLASPE